MAIEVIATIEPKNNGDFPVAKAKHLAADNAGTRLSSAIIGVATAAEMDAILTKATSESVGLMYMYIGATTAKYENGAIYRIEVE